MFTTTVRELIDSARIRHWAFADVSVGDGAALLYLNQRIRTHLGLHGAEIEGLVSASVQYKVPTTGNLVVLLNGVPTLTAGDGVAFHITNTPFATYQQGYGAVLVMGVPTIDPTSLVLSFDPFGQQFADTTVGPYLDALELPIGSDPFGKVHGGTPGFPLPADLVRMVAVGLVYNDVPTLIPCNLIRQAARLATLPGRDPSLFVTGNRLVPLYWSPTFPTADRWANVSAIQITYIPLPRVRTLTDPIALPAVLCEALTADLAVFLSQQSPKVTPVERQAFVVDAGKAAGEIGDTALGMLNDSEIETVVYRG